MRRKKGPNNQGIYDAMVADGLPVPPKPWRQLTPLQRSRYQGARAAWRARHQRKKLREMAKWISSIRENLKKTQAEFADLLGVSALTVRRWENGDGHLPSNVPRNKQPSSMQRLKNLEATLERLKEEKLEF